ncbi:hypothetical protein SAV14893_090510 [Streptomyces avermitilis]|uniref:Uncharacterized protein n=1 Tax=Streptomyces avermitilis TaxID=33903 RepID=A0A4D4MCK4_STRAX|nr:hypothetical protein SAV14893_090510 [Streptomyces avermitilis]
MQVVHECEQTTGGELGAGVLVRPVKVAVVVRVEAVAGFGVLAGDSESVLDRLQHLVDGCHQLGCGEVVARAGPAKVGDHLSVADHGGLQRVAGGVDGALQ